MPMNQLRLEIYRKTNHQELRFQKKIGRTENRCLSKKKKYHFRQTN